MIVLPNIAFIGKAGAGKSTAAEYLVRHYGYERLSFAAPLKVMCGTTDDRDLLQRVGVGVRELHADAWANLLLTEYRRLNAFRSDSHISSLGDWSPPRFVVDDCRFPNEVDALRREGFKFVQVVAGRNDRVSRLRANGKLQDEAQLEHVSETALDGFLADYAVYNDRDPEYLNDQLVTILNRERR